VALAESLVEFLFHGGHINGFSPDQITVFCIYPFSLVKIKIKILLIKFDISRPEGREHGE
jgi:hypothetical protein